MIFPSCWEKDGQEESQPQIQLASWNSHREQWIQRGDSSGHQHSPSCPPRTEECGAGRRSSPGGPHTRGLRAEGPSQSWHCSMSSVPLFSFGFLKFEAGAQGLQISLLSYLMSQKHTKRHSLQGRLARPE